MSKRKHGKDWLSFGFKNKNQPKTSQVSTQFFCKKLVYLNPFMHNVVKWPKIL